MVRSFVFACMIILGSGVASAAVQKFHECSADGSYTAFPETIILQELENEIHAGSWVFKNLRRTEDAVKATRYGDNFDINLNIDRNGKMMLRAVLSDSSLYDGMSGRKTWGYQCMSVEITTPVDSDLINNPPAAPALSSGAQQPDLDPFRDTCKELGFTPGTEKFGTCVLTLLENAAD